MATQIPSPLVCIMGCGRVGAQLAEMFHNEDYIVHMIDRNADAFDRLTSQELRDSAVLGDGTDPKILERAEIRQAEIFIAVTNGDNRNILAAQIAKVTYEVPHILCRIYDPRRHEIYRDLGIDSFCPTLNGAIEIHKIVTLDLSQPGAAHSRANGRSGRSSP